MPGMGMALCWIVQGYMEDRPKPTNRHKFLERINTWLMILGIILSYQVANGTSLRTLIINIIYILIVSIAHMMLFISASQQR